MSTDQRFSDTCEVCGKRFQDGITIWRTKTGWIHPECAGMKKDLNYLETREKMRQAKLGKVCSPETREKIRQANLGKVCSPETREKMRQAKLGKVRGPPSLE